MIKRSLGYFPRWPFVVALVLHRVSFVSLKRQLLGFHHPSEVHPSSREAEARPLEKARRQIFSVLFAPYNAYLSQLLLQAVQLRVFFTALTNFLSEL